MAGENQPMNMSLNDSLSMIRALVAEPSVSSARPDLDMGNLAVVETLAQWLDDVGFETQIQRLPSNPNKANMIATLGQGSGGLVLSGHTDTVPYDEGAWSVDPFAGVVKNDRIYGLGACDMKGFLALAVVAAQEFAKRPLIHPLILLATADEESSMHGASAIAAAGLPGARHVLIGEPTGFKPIRLHKGVMMERLRVIGATGHSSDPGLGRNALEGMNRVISALLDLRRDFQQRYRHDAFVIPYPTLNLGHIHGGDNPNRICGECELHFDVRLLPGMAIDDIRQQLQQCAEHALRDTGLRLEYEALFDGLSAMETPADSAIVRAAEAMTGCPAEGVNFGTEGPYFNQMGLDTIILGPGDIDQAHQPDEFLRLDRIPPTLDLLRSMIRRFCLPTN